MLLILAAIAEAFHPHCTRGPPGPSAPARRRATTARVNRRRRRTPTGGSRPTRRLRRPPLLLLRGPVGSVRSRPVVPRHVNSLAVNLPVIRLDWNDLLALLRLGHLRALLPDQVENL